MTKKWKLIQGILIGMLVLALAAMAGYVYWVGHNAITVIGNGEDSEYALTLERTKDWSEDAHGYQYGMQYDGAIKNHSKGGMKNWVIEIKLAENSRIDSYWNNSLEKTGDTIFLRAVEYNKIITAGDEQTFGFVIHSDMWDNVLDYKISFYVDLKVTDLPVFWVAVLGFVILAGINILKLYIRIRTKKLAEKQAEFSDIINQSFLTFANIIDAKDSYTKGHSRRVAVYTRELARRMGMCEEEQEYLYYIALLHDIGKISTPYYILNKNGGLTSEEREIIQQHVTVGGDILKDFKAIKDIEVGARYHHERYDGKGYVSGLKGEEIPLCARIICVADSFDAMSSTRCYRPKLSMENIINELKTCAGKQFDPAIVRHMLDMIREKAAPVTLSDNVDM